MQPNTTTPSIEILPSSTVEQAKEHLRGKLEEGATCPCCHQHVQMYRRPITSSMAYALVLFYLADKPADGYIHVEEYLKRQKCAASIRGDFSKLRFWKLVEPKDGAKADGNPSNGFYRITDKGKLFVENKIEVPRHVFLYNNKAYSFSEEVIGIQKTLRDRFSYDKLMKGEL